MTFDTSQFRALCRQMEQTLGQVKAARRKQLSRIADRHLARCKQNTDVGDSPDSPTLRLAWDRSGVTEVPGGLQAEVFNPTEYGPYYEFGHRQTPGRVVFIELKPGQSKYGRAAKLVKSGPHKGKWGIYLRLSKSYVKGKFVMTDSERKAQRELDNASKQTENILRKGLE